jgi:hypothetical protein
MKPRVKIYKNGWETYFCKTGEVPFPWWYVSVRNAAGEIHDKVRCDDYRAALEYFRAFNAIAKNAKANTL